MRKKVKGFLRGKKRGMVWCREEEGKRGDIKKKSWGKEPKRVPLGNNL